MVGEWKVVQIIKNFNKTKNETSKKKILVKITVKIKSNVIVLALLRTLRNGNEEPLHMVWATSNEPKIPEYSIP